MKRLYKIKWCKEKDEWHLLNPFDNDAFVMNLPDCGNFRSQADAPSKDKVEVFVVDMHRLSDTNKEYPTEGIE